MRNIFSQNGLFEQKEGGGGVFGEGEKIRVIERGHGRVFRDTDGKQDLERGSGGNFF